MRSILSTLKRKLYFIVARYFKFWASFSLKRWNPRIIAVTGSVGKTTMLHLLEVQLGDKAHYSHRANSVFGIAFDIMGFSGITNSKLRWLVVLAISPIRAFGFAHKAEFYVVEVDAERPGEAEMLAKWLRPEVTLWVSLGRSHAVYFDSKVQSGEFPTQEEAIAHEFSWLPKMTSELVVIDDANSLIRASVEGIDAKIEKIKSSAVEAYKVKPDRTGFVVNGQKFIFGQPIPKEAYVQLGMLQKLCDYLDIDVVSDLSSFEVPPGRSNYFPGIKKTNLIDSTYNAHLISMKSALGTFKAMKADKKWLVIGDMIEQGEGEGREHERLGLLISKVPADQYVLVGQRMQKYALPIIRRQGLVKKTVTFRSPDEALGFIQKNIVGGETILFKGSQYLEGIVEQLLENPDDGIWLPRRENIYVRRRQARGLPK